MYQHTKRHQFDLKLVVTDRECGAANFARKNDIPLVVLDQATHPDFSAALQRILDINQIDYAYFFFKRLLKGELLQRYRHRLLNFHPSLLPACPGLHGFEDTLKSGAILAGSTVHFIDAGMDTGPQIMQTITPALGVDAAYLRHVIFAQQCAALHHLHRQLRSGVALDRLDISEHSLAQGFYPNIDPAAINLYHTLLDTFRC